MLTTVRIFEEKKINQSIIKIKTKLILRNQTFILIRIQICLLLPIVINNLFKSLYVFFASKDTEEAVFMRIITKRNNAIEA